MTAVGHSILLHDYPARTELQSWSGHLILTRAARILEKKLAPPPSRSHGLKAKDVEEPRQRGDGVKQEAESRSGERWSAPGGTPGLWLHCSNDTANSLSSRSLVVQIVLGVHEKIMYFFSA